jgi:CheY-like chemotaxis protein
MMEVNRIEPAQVLLVEDNEDDVELTLEAFKESKITMRVHVVENGIKAMKFLRRQEGYEDKPRPDLVLLDLNLPIMDGREVLKEIREDPELTDLPVVVLTTSQSDEDITQVYKMHANCYVTKPVDFAQFTKVINQIEGFWFQLVKLPKK